MANFKALKLALNIKPSNADAIAYEAINENPRVFCSSGKTPQHALSEMAGLLHTNNITSWSAASVNFDDEGTHYLTIYL